VESRDLGESLTRTGCERALRRVADLVDGEPDRASPRDPVGLTARLPFESRRRPLRPSAVTMDGMQVWSIASNPGDPTLSSPAPDPWFVSIRRSGTTWNEVPTEFPTESHRSCSRASRRSSSTRPSRSSCGLPRFGGVWRSRDGGDSWEKCGDGLHNDDVHGVAIVDRKKRWRVFATTSGGAVSE